MFEHVVNISDSVRVSELITFSYNRPCELDFLQTPDIMFRHPSEPDEALCWSYSMGLPRALMNRPSFTQHAFAQ